MAVRLEALERITASAPQKPASARKSSRRKAVTKSGQSSAWKGSPSGVWRGSEAVAV